MKEVLNKMNSGWKKDYTRYRELFLNLVRLYNTKPTLKAYLELILTLSTVIIFAIFAIKPTILTIIDLNKEIKSKEAVVYKLKQKLTNLELASNVLQNEGQNLKLIDQAIPDLEEPDSFLKIVEGLAGQNSVQLVNFSIVNTDLSEKNKIPFTLTVSGNFTNINNFLTNLENLKRPFTVNGYAFNKKVTEDGQILVLNVTGKLPFLYEK